MTLRRILSTIKGAQIGLEDGGALILNKRDGTQIVVDSIYNAALGRYPATFAEGRGDSLEAGTGLNPLTDVYSVRVANSYNLPHRNLGVGGTGVLTQYINMTANSAATSGSLSRPVQTGNRLTMWIPGYNEMRAGNTEARLQAFRGVFAAALLLSMSNWYGLRQNYNGRSAVFFGAPAGSFAQVNVGTLSNYGVNNEFRGISGTTNGGTVTSIVQGDVVYIVYNRQHTNTGGTFSVTIDGAVVIPSVSCDGSTLSLVAGTETTTANSNGYPDVLRIPTTKGKHTVVVTVTSATNAANVVAIECVGGNDDCIGDHTAVILGMPRMNAAGYAASPAAYASVAIGDAAVAAYQQIVEEVVNEYASDGFDVRFADTTALDPSATGVVQSDNLHETYDGQTFFVTATQKSYSAQRVKPADAKSGEVVTITMPASDTLWRNTYRMSCDLVLTGGTVTAVKFSRDGTTANLITVAAGTPAMLRLDPDDQFLATYSVAPTAQLIPR